MSTTAHFILIALVLCASAQAQTPAGQGKKKGLAGWSGEHRAKVGAVWYYNWGPKPDGNAGAAEFVPMVKGPNFEWQLAEARKITGPGKNLLGFNEPERASQGNLTVERAIELWPKLMETGARLGSPATSSDGAGMAWLERFMAEVEKRKLRVDFIAVHWYRSADPAAFEDWLKELDRKYRRPVWITEFNGWKVGEREHERFMKGAVRALERLSFVERYAYFTWSPGQPGSLFKADLSLSKVGEIYRAAD